MKNTILIVEDEDKLRRVVQLQLLTAGFEVLQASTAEQGLKLADQADLILTDLRLPGMDGLALLAELRRQNSTIPVIVMTAFGTVESAVEAMKRRWTAMRRRSTAIRRSATTRTDQRPGAARHAAALRVRQHTGRSPAMQ